MSHCLGDLDVLAPEELNLHASARNEKMIAAWWANARLYIAAMKGLEREVLIRHDEDDGVYYFASIPEVIE